MAPTPPGLLEDLPLIEADVLDLMEAEYLRPATAVAPRVSAAALPQLPPPSPLPRPPVVAEHVVSHSQPQQMDLAPMSLPQPISDSQYNKYTSVPSIYTTSPQHQQQQFFYRHQQPTGNFDARVISLQNRQVMLNGKNVNAGTTARIGAFPADYNHADMNHQNKQTDILLLCAPPPPPPPPPPSAEWNMNGMHTKW